jgi:hypothetical protein
VADIGREGEREGEREHADEDEEDKAEEKDDGNDSANDDWLACIVQPHPSPTSTLLLASLDV